MNLPKQFLLKKNSGPKQKHIANKLNFHHVILYIIIIFFKASKSRAYVQLSVGKLPKKDKKSRKTFDIKFN